MRAGWRRSIRAVVAPSTPIVRFHVCSFFPLRGSLSFSFSLINFRTVVDYFPRASREKGGVVEVEVEQ